MPGAPFARAICSGAIVRVREARADELQFIASSDNHRQKFCARISVGEMKIARRKKIEDRSRNLTRFHNTDMRASC